MRLSEFVESQMSMLEMFNRQYSRKQLTQYRPEPEWINLYLEFLNDNLRVENEDIENNCHS